MIGMMKAFGTFCATGILWAAALGIPAGSTALNTDSCIPALDWLAAGQETYSGVYFGSVAFDSEGNVVGCHTGISRVGGEITMELTKVAPKGKLLWRIIKPSCAGFSIAIDKNDNIIVGGSTMECGPYPSCAYLEKFDPAGKAVWSLSISGMIVPFGPLTAIALDKYESIYAAGPGQDGWQIYRFESDGTWSWLDFLDFKGMPRAAAILSNGDKVFVGNKSTQETPSSTPYLSGVLVRYGSDNEIDCEWIYDPGTGSTELYGIAENPVSGSIYVCGMNGYNNSFVARFGEYGQEGFCSTNFMGSVWGAVRGIDVGPGGDIWLTGGTPDPITYEYQWRIWKYEDIYLQPCSSMDDDWLFGSGRDWGRAFGLAIGIDKQGTVAALGSIEEDYLPKSAILLFNDRGQYGTGPVASGSPTEPGPEHPGGLKPGDVRVAGGTRGLVDPMRGEGASVSVYPTSAGTVTLTVIDRKGGVVKQVSAPASGTGAVTLTWDGKNASGSPVAPGIYAVRVEGPGIRQVSKVAVVY